MLNNCEAGVHVHVHYAATLCSTYQGIYLYMYISYFQIYHTCTLHMWNNHTVLQFVNNPTLQGIFFMCMLQNFIAATGGGLALQSAIFFKPMAPWSIW